MHATATSNLTPASGPAAAANHVYWQRCQDTHVANAGYYQRVRSVLPLLCELHLAPGHRVLDVGCGNGEYSAVIARHCAWLDGIDLAPALIDQALALGLPNADFAARGVDTLDRLPDAAYDALFVMGVFATLHGGLFEATVAQLQRLLKPGGVLITRDSVTPAQDVVRRVNDGYHAHYRSADHYAGVFTAAGLRMQRAVYLETFTGIDNYFFVFRRD